MRAQVADALAMLAFAALLLLLIPQLMKFWKEFFDTLALASAEVVARDLAGLICASAAAPSNLSLSYGASSEVEYNVTLKDRQVEVQMLRQGKALGKSAKESYCVDGLEGSWISNHFELKKVWIEDRAELTFRCVQ